MRDVKDRRKGNRRKRKQRTERRRGRTRMQVGGAGRGVEKGKREGWENWNRDREGNTEGQSDERQEGEG